ncbi:MAG: glycerol kinase GlpK [Verrucomicrobiota bacterium]
MSGSGPYVMALDQGTTSSRAIVFDRAGRIVASRNREFAQRYPQEGWVEHDPEQIWLSQIETAWEALAAAGLEGADLAAIGIANQRETTIIWERATGKPIAPAIVWQDRRTAGLCDRWREDGLDALVQARTGLLIDPYFSASKIAWLLEHVDGARARAEAGKLAFGTVDSWLIWKLTEGATHATDATNAGRTMLYNIHEGRWDGDLLEAFGVPAALLPTVHPSSGLVAEVAGGHPLRGVPITGCAGDQHAALFGQACFEPGMAKNTYGTGCFMMMQTGAEVMASRHRLLSTLAWQIGDEVAYALEGGVFIGGAVVQWLRDELEIIHTSDEIEPLARSVEHCRGTYLVPAFTGFGAPHWDARARGLWVGMTRGTSRGHLARAALEAIAFQSHEVLTAMEKDAGLPLRELRVDGGASRNDLLMQFQADLLGTRVTRPRVTETTALGAAFLAGLAVGYWRDKAEIAALWAKEASFKPRDQSIAEVRHQAGWKRAVERAKDWAREDAE